MRCLSVRPPWAWAILYGGKSVENRTRRTWHRGPLLIHAAKTISPLDRFPTGMLVPPEATAVRGAVVGLVDMVDCLAVAEVSGNPWAVGPWCWMLANPRPLPHPIPWAGQVSLFDVPDDLIR
jgi:hypothetical protein